MRLVRGTIRDSRAIAAIYRRAFPDSIRLFFAKKEPGQLLVLLELAFNLVFLWGGQAIVAVDETGRMLGYCLYAPAAHPEERDYARLFLTGTRLLTKISPGEAWRFVCNQLLMSLSVRTTKKQRQPAARIISIAVDPPFQAEGMGTVLLNAALQRLDGQAIILNVRADNRAGHRLYKAAGFYVRGSRRDLAGQWLMLSKDPK